MGQTMYQCNLSTVQEGNQLQSWNLLGWSRERFMNAFWDTATREHTEEKLHNLSWTPGDVDAFVAQFWTLADEAEYPLDDWPTISLFASKLPYKMMEHILLIIKSRDFQGWADAARQYHQDNTAVQNMRNFNSDVSRESLGTRRQDSRPSSGSKSWGLRCQPQILMQWTHAPIEPVPTLGTRDLKAALTPPKKIQSNSIKKGTVSPAPWQTSERQGQGQGTHCRDWSQW